RAGSSTNSANYAVGVVNCLKRPRGKVPNMLWSPYTGNHWDCPQGLRGEIPWGGEVPRVIAPFGDPSAERKRQVAHGYLALTSRRAASRCCGCRPRPRTLPRLIA